MQSETLSLHFSVSKRSPLQLKCFIKRVR